MPAKRGYKGGVKFPPGAPELPALLRNPMSADDLSGSPKGKRVGPLGDTPPRPPVSRRDKGKQRASVTGRG